MKSIVIKNAYGLENTTVENQDIPTIQDNEVLVKVKAMSLNQLDLMVAKGAFATKLPHTLGSDAVGIVKKIGTHVTKFNVGDTVSTHFVQSWQSGVLKASDSQSSLGTSVKGVFSEYISLSENALVKAPQNLTVEEASTLPIAGLTAWETLVNFGNLKAGQTVLLQGTGGVSIFALQFAKMIGAKVILISSNDEKLKTAKSLGADEVVNYRTNPDWQDKVLKITKGNGVDLALEISWAGINKTITAMKTSGKIAVIGMLGGTEVQLSVFDLIQRSLTIKAMYVGSKSSFEEMNNAIEVNNIKPIIDRVFSVSELPEAIAHFEKSKHLGKVVLIF
ncbi:zinc-dependent alcohol dehydrogenase family protein [Ichthyenterobacterium magnum]|uniref:NADPH:quinone reductase-like Zn-dependent oxidoreductase n=1 Tax=Ichthyenterobacterium magnum TaxID=1230530 RepID=A0A420DV33_9FLAO|nr:NAD(P)-dependent alcohol dehydrogenase [Ichthyenterobacterium magnum]RKE98136.1 NADPH:quinone reductase-like Zn-dependent oxidoreductase [Ichthyenterobacterium magnum]